MKCILCGRICDDLGNKFCVDCIAAVNRTNERVLLLSLLKEAANHCPDRLQRKIDAVIGYQMPLLLDAI